MGWVKLHREILEKAIWKCSTSEQKVILVTMLILANHKEVQWIWKGGKFKCYPGQFITSIKSLANYAMVSEQNVRTALAKFEKLEFLTNESTKTGRLITICNWDRYQSIEIDINKPPNKDLTNSQQRTNKDLTPNKNDKEEKNEDNERKKKEEKELFNGLKTVFMEHYKHIKKVDYYFTAKCAGNLKKIQKQLIYLNKGSEDNLIVIWKYILQNMNDKWVIENLSIPIINLKFNEIVAKIKGEKKPYDVNKIMEGIRT